MLLAIPAWGATCDDYFHKPNDCLKQDTCFYDIYCQSCPKGYKTDLNAYAQTSCYKWTNSEKEGVAQQKCYWQSGNTCKPNGMSCSGDTCNFTCASTHHRYGNNCDINIRDCTGNNKVTNSETCTEEWNAEKNIYERTDFTCKSGYMAWDDTCKAYESISCNDYIRKFYDSAAKICDDKTDTRTIQGQLGSDDEGNLVADCECKTTNKKNTTSKKDTSSKTNTGKCYLYNYFTNDHKWTEDRYSDCECAPNFCKSEYGTLVFCDIPNAGYWAETVSTTDAIWCKKCPASTTSNFGTNVTTYLKTAKAHPGIQGCQITQGTQFCDSVGCFTLPITNDTVYYQGSEN